MDNLPPPLAPLGAWPQFVCWFAVPHPDKPGKFNKFPCNWATGDVIDAHDPRHWTTAVCALACASQWDRGHGAGAGFVFTEADPFFFGDVDKAYDGQAWSAVAVDLCNRLGGVAVEVSHSGVGLHLIGITGAIEHGCKNTPLGLELYTSGRFVALTGTHARGSAAVDATVPLAAVVAQYFPPTAVGEWEGWTTQPVAEYAGPPDDDELIRKALASAARAVTFAPPDGSNAPPAPTFADLWAANVDVLAARWPGEGFKPFGQSEADQALANALAFWTGKNCDRMERLMRRSALARDKWDSSSHRDYLANTILKACAFVHTVYSQPPAPAAAPVQTPPTPEVLAARAVATGRTLRDASREYMGPHDQLEFFGGCFYDNTTEKIYSLGRNTVFTKSAFDINYGGHLFILDPSSQKTTDSAWEAFTRSRVNAPVIVDALCFRPELPGGAFVMDGNRVYANSYVKHHVEAFAGDASPFLDHVAKMLPDAGDAEQLLSYMASMAQNPGKKFQWWPVVQGAEGNGKTILIFVMTHIMGQEYTHLPNAHAMARDGNKFNGWIYRKLFIGIEEIALSSKRDFLDEFKVVVTNERVPLEKKGQDQFTGDNRVNGILCTNHKDGVPITVDTRRYAIFYTAQQNATHLQRDGMDEAYFAGLWEWMKGPGKAIVAEYLLTYPLKAELDPARLSTRAPKTTSTTEALFASMGRAEQEIIDAIEEGRPGFAGGWVSSKQLDILLEQIRAPVPRNKRRPMMQSLGYDYHGGLPDGRVNDPVTPDGMKPRLYIRNGHAHAGMINASQIARAYSAAQAPSASKLIEVTFEPPAQVA